MPQISRQLANDAITELSPIPRAEKAQTRTRHAESTEVVTGSPYKKMLTEKMSSGKKQTKTKINGIYRPIAFASCTVSESQKNYSQLEKEAFSIIFGFKCFHQLLAGRSFTVITDHRPLFSLSAPEKSAPTHTAATLQR